MCAPIFIEVATVTFVARKDNKCIFILLHNLKNSYTLELEYFFPPKPFRGKLHIRMQFYEFMLLQFKI